MEYEWRAMFYRYGKNNYALSDTELRECELTCHRVSKNERKLKLGMWW